MEPMEVRQEHVTTGTAVTPAATAYPASTGYVTPVAATPVATPVAGTTTSVNRVGFWPAGYPVIQAIWLIAGILTTFLALDVLLRAFGANDVGIASLIYSVGNALSAPFVGIFNGNSANTTHIYADLAGIVVYSLVAYVLTRIVRISVYGSRNRTAASPTTTTL